VRQELTACWIAVTNAGGAAGFPFPPVNASHVAPAVDTLAARLDPQRNRILLARSGGTLAGWVALSRDPSPLIAHWGTVNHLQTLWGSKMRFWVPCGQLGSYVVLVGEYAEDLFPVDPVLGEVDRPGRAGRCLSWGQLAEGAMPVPCGSASGTRSAPCGVPELGHWS